MKLAEWISAIIYPPKCVLCGSLLEKDQTDLCRRCRLETSAYTGQYFPIPFLAQWRAMWYYEGNVRQSLLRYKFSGRRVYALSYARLLAMRLQEWELEFDLLTAVPISPARRRKRGYDQVGLLMRAVSRELGIPMAETLKKVRNAPPQSGLSERSQRKANVLGAFRPVHPERFAGKRVLLLDDIVTTGATASECARVLLTAGAKEVKLAAIAAARHKISR